MGVRQSKRSVDITETATKGEIEGFGNEGKVEKIIDGVVEKVAANGHVEADLQVQNGVEAHQNGIEPLQNGEAAAVAADEIVEPKEMDESAAEDAVNGQVENGEINGEAENIGDETKKSPFADEKKEKKKEKKDKVVKKKFSFRNFSFSKKDKSKPPKEEKSPGKMDETGIQEMPNNAEKDEPLVSPSVEDMIAAKSDEGNAKSEVTANTVTSIAEESKVDNETAEKLSEMKSNTKIEDIPPPLPASPPPREPVEGKAVPEIQGAAAVMSSFQEKFDNVTSSITYNVNDKIETSKDILKDAEKIAIETGKQIEEKATNLLKTVEERAEESMRTAGELISQKVHDVVEAVENTFCGKDKSDPDKNEEDKKELKQVEEIAKKVEEALPTIPVELSNLASLSTKMEESSDKQQEESGAGESLADIPKDLADVVAAANIEAINPDSLEIPSPTIPELPPPVATEGATE